MENKIVTEDVVVEHVAKNLILEHVAVSGTLFVTVDKKLLYTHQFKDHVKVHIVFDNTSVDDIKGNNQLHFLDSRGDEADEDSANQVNSCEDEDILIDDSLIMKFGAASYDSINIKKPESQLAPGNYGVQRKLRGANDAPMKKTACTSKLTIPEKKVPPRERTKRNYNVKLVADKIKEEVEVDENISDFHENDSDCQDTQVNNENSDSKEKVICCNFCSKSFKSQAELLFHRKAESQCHPCPKCPRIFKFKAYLMIHIRDHHQETTPKVSKSELVQSDSDGKSKEECEICGSVFSSLNNLKLHLMLHTSEFAYQCCICPQQMRTITIYEKHMAKHSKLGRIQCKICKIRVNSRSELFRHQLTHPVNCGLCGQVFPNKTGRYFHYKTVHKNDILKCPQCDRLYSCKKALEKHLKYHRNRHQTQCPVCGLFFYRLPEHMVLHGGSEKTGGEAVESTVFVCDKCPKQFNKKKSFDRHLKTHSEEKPYTCTECSKQFAESKGLRRHMVIHLQEKPYVCKVCGKACSQKGNLKVHMQIHMADRARKVLQCSQCGASFNQRNALQEHIDKEHSLEENILQFPQQYFQMNTFYHG